MNNKEFEISFKVKDLEVFYKYCFDNNYVLIDDTKQKRILYKKEDKTMARITIKEANEKVIQELDFKEDKLSDDVAITRNESKSLIFENMEAAKSIIDFLGYKKDIELIRNRKVYKKEDIKFEIDEYSSPEKMLVVAIEGNETKAYDIYNELKELYDDLIIK